MNCKQLYEMDAKQKDWIAGTLVEFFDHDEVSDKDGIYRIEEKALNEKISVKDIVNYCFDGRRVWVLKSLWFDNKPFAIMQEAGREGDDHRDRYISNAEVFKECVDFINSLLQPKIEEINGLVDENQDMANLTSFYGHKLQDFLTEGYEPRYKVGDEVEIKLSSIYQWTKPLVEKGLLNQKAIVVRQKECSADDILVELYDYYDHKRSLWGFSNNKHISELIDEDMSEYKRKTVWVDDDLKHSHR